MNDIAPVSTSLRSRRAARAGWVALCVAAALLLATSGAGQGGLSAAQAANRRRLPGFLLRRRRGKGSDPGQAPEQAVVQRWHLGGVLFNKSSEEFHIYRYDAGSNGWTDTGTLVDERNGSHSDALWDGEANKSSTSQAPARATETHPTAAVSCATATMRRPRSTPWIPASP